MGWVKRAKLRIKILVTDIHSISTREVIRMHMRLRNLNELGEARATMRLGGTKTRQWLVLPDFVLS